MPAVESLLQLYNLDEKDGAITAFDSYGFDLHLGTSSGQLIRLTVSGGTLSSRHGEMKEPTTSGCEVQSSTNYDNNAPSSVPANRQSASISLTTEEMLHTPQEDSLRTIVSRRCTLSETESEVQQLQHSRSQRVLFVLCEGRLLLLHAETYTILGSIATNVVSFSVAQPACSKNGKTDTNSVTTIDGSSAPSSALPSHDACPSRLPSGRPINTGESDITVPHSHNISHTRNSSEDSYGSFQPWTPRSSATSSGHKSSKAYVVCVAEKNKKELAVYLVDRVCTHIRSTAAVLAVASRQSKSLAPFTSDLTSGNGGDGTCRHQQHSLTNTPSALPAPPPRVVLRQRYVLPEPAQRVIMCTPPPLVTQLPTAMLSSTGANVGASQATSTVTAAEAGLTVCVGMRREVSLLPLLGGVPRCILRLDGSLPPLLSIGSDHNTYLVRTQAPNTVMEVGVPPSAASAGLHGGAAGEAQAAALVNPITLRMGYHRLSAAAKAAWDSKQLLASALSFALPDKDGDLIMGDVFQSDAAVELVLTRFPFVFLFTATHCDVISLLGENRSIRSYGGPTSNSTSSSSAVQRIPIPGIRHGALRGQGTSLFVASDHAVWSLRLSPLRAQLAEMVYSGHNEEAFQIFAFYQQRALSLAHRASARKEPPLALLERDLHRMAGFTSLHRGDVATAVRTFRGHLDPRELLLSLPDCIPPTALALKPSFSPLSPPQMVSKASPAACCTTKRCEYTLQCVEVGMSAAEVRDFLYLEEEPLSTTAQHANTTDQRAMTSTEIQAVETTYWGEWSGPCVYNTCAGDVSHAWRTAFEASSVPATASSSSASETTAASAVADAFVARCYDTLKDEVRTWFMEELFSAEKTMRERGESAKQAKCTRFSVANDDCATPRRRDDADSESGGSPLSLSASELPHACSLVYRRAMSYASLVLAWEARDYHTAYQLVARMNTLGLQVEDCVEMLTYLREYRLLALLRFQSGEGDESVRILKEHVCLSRTLLPAPSKTALLFRKDTSFSQPDHVLTQMARWRSCMESKFERGVVSGSSLCNHQAGEASYRSALHSAYQTSQDELICGRGLLMQPSMVCVARVAHALFGIDDGDAIKSPSAQCQSQGRLLDEICAAYASQVGSTSTSTNGNTAFVQLYFAASDGSASSTPFTLPHIGPVLTVASTSSQFTAAAIQHGNGGTSQSFQTNADASGVNGVHTEVSPATSVHVLPSPLSEFFYAVEKLDVRTVRQLLTQQPRMVHVRDLDGCTALHVALAQVRVITTTSPSSSSSPCENTASTSTVSPQVHERERFAEVQAAMLKVICAVVGLLVHVGCPVSTLNCNGWSCLDVAAMACGNNATVFDIITAALLAAVELRKTERAAS